MGGRGASSGMSVKGNKFGSQYRTVLTHGNIKFVVPRVEHPEELLETMTRGRVYVHVESGELKLIVYFDEENKRSKQIDLDHPHGGRSPHVHDGYYHNEYRGGLTEKEWRMVARVRKLWDNRISK